MANEKLCSKNYLQCQDDKLLTKTRKKVNAKSHKKRVYGTDHGYFPSALGGDGIGESMSKINEMHNGVIPGTFSSNVFAHMSATSNDKDMKRENRRSAPRKRSFAEFLQWRNRAEEEENTIDPDEWNAAFSKDAYYPSEEDMDFDFPFDPYVDDPTAEFNPNTEYDDFPFDPYVDDDQRYPENEEQHRRFGSFDDEFDDEDDEFEDDDEFNEFEDDDDEFNDDEFDDDPEEFDDFDAERELNFDDEYQFDGYEDDEYDNMGGMTGQLVNFYRLDNRSSIRGEEEQEATGPGGFTPGQAAGQPAASSGNIQAPKIDRARILFQQLINRPDSSRRYIIDQFIQRLDVTESTAVSYYERIAKEFGLTKHDDDDVGGELDMGMGDEDISSASSPETPEVEMSQEELDQQEPNQQGIIRRVEGAHLVYKRQMEDGGFEELWVYNIGDTMKDSLDIRRAILAGTDIPRGHTRSDDGQQSYTLTTMGNAQLLHITGLHN
jgi:hypothetical protein